MSLNETGSLHFLPGDTTFVIFNTVILLFMLPGFSFFYSGLTHPGSSITILMTPLFTIVIIFLQWWFIGYSLSFSQTSGPFLGDFSNVFLTGVYNSTNPLATNIPELVFCFYQCVTAMLPAAILLGAIAERGRLLPALFFILLWTTFVYDIICYWSLNSRGWSFHMGLLDYGGASPVHVPSAAAALAYSSVLGPLTRPTDFVRPRSMSHIMLGTTLIWIGTYGNVAGAAMAANMRSTLSAIAVALTAAGGAVAWCTLDYWRYGKLTAFGYCCGAVAGIVAITPCAGFVSSGSSIAVGAISGVAANVGSALRAKYQFNDVLEVFMLHGVGGIVGAILTGVLSEKYYVGDMMEKGGWLDGNWPQVGIQLADLVATSLWSYIFSYVTLFLCNKTLVLKLRVDAETELNGLDEKDVGVSSYEMTVGSSSKY